MEEPIPTRSGRILISGRPNRHLKSGKSTLQSAAQIAAQTHHHNPLKRPGTARIHLYLTTTYAKLGLFVIDRPRVQVRSSAPLFSIVYRQSVHHLLHNCVLKSRLSRFEPQHPGVSSPCHCPPSAFRTIRSVSFGRSSSLRIHSKKFGSLSATSWRGSPLCFLLLLKTRMPLLITNQ